MFSTIIAKQQLRQEIKLRLAALTTEERKRQSCLVTEKVLNSSEYKESQRVCLYLSMPDEVCTLEILKNIFESGKTCFIPRYTRTEMEMLRILSFDDFNNLPLTAWNIKQPETPEGRPEALATGGLDLILLPGLAFTLSGHRLGRGKGYYDSYLTKCNAASSQRLPFTIGLAFNEQIVNYIPTDDHDHPLNKVFSASSPSN